MFLCFRIFAGANPTIERRIVVHIVTMKRKRSDIEDALEQENTALRKQIAEKDEKIQKLEHQLENRNAHAFIGGESFSETSATPHLLSRALERVFTTSSAFTKLLMQCLRTSGIDCTALAKLTKSVAFERDAHTKFVYQALNCQVLFADFELDNFGVETKAIETLDPEERAKEAFQRYKQLITVEKPEELVLEDAIDNELWRVCIAKRKGLMVALGALGVGDVFAGVFGARGIRRPECDAVASSFVRCVLSVLLVHKLATALHPIARIFRVPDGMRFSERYMEPVVASGDSEVGEDGLLSVGFMVVPGLHVNRIVVHSRVYTVKRIELDTRVDEMLTSSYI